MPAQLLRRVRTSQPQTPTRLSSYWVSRGLVLAIQQDWYATPYGTFPLVKTNSPANLPSEKGRVSGFGTTYAGNTNSYLTGPVLTHPKSGWRSWFVLLYANSTGGSGFGRVFQHATGTGADGAGGEAILCVGTTNELRYEKFPTLGSSLVSEYKSPAAIPLNTWTSYGITHQQVFTDTLPQGYKNGVAETWSILTACGAGSVSASPPTSLAIGNRPSDTARTWDGMIGIQLYFDGALSAADHAAIHANPWQVFAEETIPLFWTSVTAQFARPTSDASAGTWTASTGSDLYAMIDETVASDTDYISTVNASTCEVALSTLSDPASSSGHIVRYRLSAEAGGVTVRLRQGTTTIASWTHSPAPASLTTYAQTLSGGEADSITDYTALKLQFEATE